MLATVLQKQDQTFTTILYFIAITASVGFIYALTESETKAGTRPIDVLGKIAPPSLRIAQVKAFELLNQWPFGRQLAASQSLVY